MIKDKEFKWKISLDCPGSPNRFTGIRKSKELFQLWFGGDVMEEKDQKCNIAVFEDGERVPWANVGGPWRKEKAG